MAAMDIQQQLDGNHNRRMANQARIDYARWDRRSDEAEAMIGELQGERGRRFYINVRSSTGRMTGRIVEFKSRFDAIAYLMRNGYV